MFHSYRLQKSLETRAFLVRNIKGFKQTGAKKYPKSEYSGYWSIS